MIREKDLRELTDQLKAKEETAAGELWPDGKPVVMGTPDTCARCGILWIMPTEFFETRRPDGNLCCPNGHSGGYSAKTAAIAKKNVRHISSYERLVCKCGLDFWMLKEMVQLRREDHANFYCPAGHVNNFPEPVVPRTPEEIDYSTMLQYHEALARIVLLKPGMFRNKKELKLAINIARNALSLEKLKDDR